MSIEKIQTNKAPAAIGPYSQGVRAGDYIFFSGQIPLDAHTGEVVSGGIVEQSEKVMENLGALLSSVGLGFDSVVKTTIYLIDLGDFSTVNTIYGNFFGEIPPARATVQVSALPKGVSIEIECVAYCGQ